MLMTIKKRWSGDVIWEGDAETMVDALRKALNEGKSLRYADLTDANLTRANLTDANTALARADVRSILTAAPHEVAGLKAALIAGQVNGQLYSGPCACLLGTIANARHCDVSDLVNVNPELRQNPNRPAERWFMGIKPGQTPENHPISALTLAWIEQWEADARIVALAYSAQ